jgi:mannose-6-phosphate isomerase
MNTLCVKLAKYKKQLLKHMKQPSIFSKIKQDLVNQDFIIKEENLKKPWGGYFLIDDSQIEKFIKKYFSHIELPPLDEKLKLSPKILIIAPEKQISWQYHHRRREIWTVTQGSVKIVLNDNDELIAGKTYQQGDFVNVDLKQRHRLVGLDDWGVVAEIWIHTDPKNPSNEADIVRVADDFGR